MLLDRVRQQYAGSAAVTEAEPYITTQALEEAVEVSIQLGRPLLIKGEPGCGKTRLARAVANALRLRYLPWHVKSTSRARDGLYTYDAVGRLRDAQLAASARWWSRSSVLAASYVRLGPLGEAFQEAQGAVVLIDEIDKADIDFPNDLLLELDEGWFTVEETGQRIEARRRPVVIVTSNDEKDLPDAFLRRCVFHYIPFPMPDDLVRIVQAHFPDAAQHLVDAVVERFIDLRGQVGGERGGAGKRPSTSELIDWYRILTKSYGPERLLHLVQDRKQVPFAGVVIKSQEDLQHWIAPQANRR